MRQLSRPEVIPRVRLTLTEPCKVATGDWSQVSQEYEAKINSGDIIAIAEVMRDLYRPSLNADQSYGERQLYEAALDRLSGEFAVIQRITEQEARDELESLVIAASQEWGDTKNGPTPDDPGPQTKQRFRVTQVSQAFSGRPLLHIEPAPISHDGWPDLSRELEEVIEPYLKGSDNIALRFIDNGLPTTTTAVIGSVEVQEERFAIQYAIRTMIFETTTSKPGCNIHIRPEVKSILNFFGKEIGREKISESPTYDFREVYENAEASRDDLSRLVKIAHSHFMNRQ